MRVSLLCHGRLPAQNLELRLQDRGFSFPVGRVGFQTLRPLSFFEFLDATGNGDDAEETSEGQVPSGSGGGAVSPESGSGSIAVIRLL